MYAPTLTWGQILGESGEFFHCLDDLCHREVVDDLLARLDDLPHLRLVKHEQQPGHTGQDACTGRGSESCRFILRVTHVLTLLL